MDASPREPGPDGVPDDGPREPAGQRLAANRIPAGELLLTVGGPDGSEVVPLPAAARPDPELRLPTRIPVAAPARPCRGRDGEIAALSALLSRGTSIRLTGPAGIGRTTLLRHLAGNDPAGAPDGVIVLDGHRRGFDDLLQALYETCFPSDLHRPARHELPALLRPVAALVVVDDLELSSLRLAELMRIVPECAFLTATVETGGEPGLRQDTGWYVYTLAGLPQEDALTLLESVAGRDLDDEELAWAAALWFETLGHPGRFVQAGALLARRDTGSLSQTAFGPGLLGELPSPSEPETFVARLAPLLSRPASQVLRLAAALDGELPDPIHLPALTGADDAEAALAELEAAGLVSAGRAAGGVAREAAPIMRGSSSWAVAAVQHFTWWVSHPSVSPVEVADEAHALLACLREVDRLGKGSSVRALARAAAPAFAAGLRWEAWEETLRIGLAAAVLAESLDEEAWFRHELAAFCLCSGDVAQAREEAAAAVRLRESTPDKRGLTVSRRLLALAGGERKPAAVGQARRTVGGHRGLITVGAAVVLAVTLAAVVGMGSGNDGGTPGESRPPGTGGPAVVGPQGPVGGPAPGAVVVSGTAAVTATTQKGSSGSPKSSTASPGATRTTPRSTGMTAGSRTTDPPGGDTTTATTVTTPPVTPPEPSSSASESGSASASATP